jgi:thiol-disulfide isomerase/thioredoxin
MKRIFFLVQFGLIAVIAGHAQAKLSANDMFKQACDEAAASNKKVFVIFTASWCGWCHRMDNSMVDEVCKKYFDENFVVIHFVVDESPEKKELETAGAPEFRTKYHGDGQGIPFWLVFDKDGKLLADSKMRKEGEGPEKGQNSGCPANEPEVVYFIDVLKKTTSLKEDELQTIYKRFRKNEN